MLRVGIIDSHKDIHQVVLLLSLWDMSVYEFSISVIGLIEVG